MAGLGKNVLLMRDMTDTMYNSRRRPYVSHFAGTGLVIEHIEKHWCPTITSADLLGGEPFRFKDDVPPHLVFLIGESEYNTKTTLPEFAQKELAWRGLRCTIVHAGDKDPNDFAGLEAIKNADLLFVSVRRRSPLKAQIEFIRNHLNAGKPLIGIRTASHAFDTKAPDEQHAAWSHFDEEVLGANYQGHYNNTPASGRLTLVAMVSVAAKHPVLTGLPAEGFQSASTLYRSANLAPSVTALLMGTIQGGQEREPVAWVNTAQGRRVFYTSLGGPDDFQVPAFRRLLLNAVLWALERPVPPAQ
jgi:type 1 glutamine amidotransferase